jgi:hypothetical protein
MTDLRDAQEKGFIGKAWHFNSVLGQQKAVRRNPAEQDSSG